MIYRRKIVHIRGFPIDLGKLILIYQTYRHGTNSSRKFHILSTQAQQVFTLCPISVLFSLFIFLPSFSYYLSINDLSIYLSICLSIIYRSPPPMPFKIKCISFLSCHTKLPFSGLKFNLRDFPGGAVVKNPPDNAGHTGSSPGWGRSHMPRSN